MRISKNSVLTNFTKNEAPNINSTLFQNTTLSDITTRWSEYWPYQLMLVEVQNGKYAETKYKYTLPISPQELTVDMPMATTTIPTLNGIVEQHGGVPFRIISIQGSTGIAPIKNSGDAHRDGILGGVVDIGNFAFGGTAQNINGIAKNATKTLRGKSYEINKNDGTTTYENDNNRIHDKSTGFYQYLLLEQFLASYHNLKQINGKLDQIDAKNIRLAFCIWKENAVYLVSGVQLTKKRSVSSPMEYTYNLQLKAWAKVNLSASDIRAYQFRLAARSPSVMADIFNRIRNARETIKGAASLIDSVLKETGQLANEGLRQTTLCLKVITGIQPMVEDFPEYIQKACVKSIMDNWATLQMTQAQLGGFLKSSDNKGKPIDTKFGGSYAPSSDAVAQIPPTAIPLPQAINDQINQELVTAANFSRLDYQGIKGILVSASVELADKIGAGDSNYHTYYDIPTNNIKSRTPTDQEWGVLYALQESIQVLDYLAASSEINPPTIDSMDYIAGLAEQAGIAFQKPKSKFAIPFPYGVTLEQLALQYLGDANRWMEIATLNGLKEPYIDEEGFKINLLTNGDRNKLLVLKDNRFFIGQSIWITARFLREKRRIIDIEEVGNNFVITVDGEADLQRFKTIEGAYIEAFLPSTVNSQQTIFIPSQHTPSDDPESKQIPGVDEFDPLLEVGGVDLLLTDSYDLAITNAGDCRLAYGLANIIQIVKIALSTKRGADLQHPTFGFNVSAGTSVADIDVPKLVEAISETFSEDPMFSGVTVTSTKLNGNTLTIDLIVEVVGVSKYIPLTIQFKP